MADSEEPPERAQDLPASQIKVEQIRAIPASGLVRTMSGQPTRFMMTSGSAQASSTAVICSTGTGAAAAPVIVPAVTVPPGSVVSASGSASTLVATGSATAFHHPHVQTLSKPVTRISAVPVLSGAAPATSYHVPRGAAAVANIAAPRGSVATPIIRATPVAASAGSLQPITVTPHHTIQATSGVGGAIVARSLSATGYTVGSGGSSPATVSIVPRHQIKPASLPSAQAVAASRSIVRPAIEAQSRPVVLQTTTTHKQIGDKGGAVLKSISSGGGNRGIVGPGGATRTLASGLSPMVPLGTGTSTGGTPTTVLVSGGTKGVPVSATGGAVLVPTKATQGTPAAAAIMKSTGTPATSGAVLVASGKASGAVTSVPASSQIGQPTSAAVLVTQPAGGAGKAIAVPPRHPTPLPPSTLHHQQSTIISSSALITRPVVISSATGGLQQTSTPGSTGGGTIVRSGVTQHAKVYHQSGSNISPAIAPQLAVSSSSTPVAPVSSLSQETIGAAIHQPLYIQHKPHIVGGTSGTCGSSLFNNSSGSVGTHITSSGPATAVIQCQAAPPPLVHSGSQNVLSNVTGLAVGGIQTATTSYVDSRRPPTPHQPSVQSHISQQGLVTVATAGQQMRYNQSTGHVMVLDTKRIQVSGSGGGPCTANVSTSVGGAIAVQHQSIQSQPSGISGLQQTASVPQSSSVEVGVPSEAGSNSVLPGLTLSLGPKQTTSPRPSILRKRDPESWSPVKAQKNLTPVLTGLSVSTGNVGVGIGGGDDENGLQQAAGSGGSSTLSAASSPGEDHQAGSVAAAAAGSAPVLALAPAPPAVLSVVASVLSPTSAGSSQVDQFHHHHNQMQDDLVTPLAASLDVSPRKKPRKQQLPQNNQASEPSAFSDEDMEFISQDNKAVSTQEKSIDYYEEQEKRKRMTLWRSKQVWKPTNGHFMRYTDVKPKEEKKPTLTELASQKHAMTKINGWKIYHLLSQVEDMASSENEYLNIYSDLLNYMELKQKKLKGRDYDSKNYEILNRINERIKANSARCKVVNDHMDEARLQIMKLFDHKAYVADLVNRCANKRANKKRERM